MKKYLLRYLVFWLPALFVSLLLMGSQSLPADVPRFFCGFFLLLGWAVNTGMAAYEHPRATLSLLLFYLGGSLLLIHLQYMGILPRLLGRHSLTIAGLLSYTPLDIFLQKLLDFKIPHEVYITVGITLLCFVGWLLGLLYRYHNPNPYRPRIKG